MRSIFTYPNNASTNYIDPAYDGDDTEGFQKRIKELRDGDYKSWNGFDPGSVDLDEIQTGIGEYYKMYDSINLGNLKIYDFYTFPLVTHDTTRIQNSATGSDTDNTSGATITVTGHQFVDSDRVELSGFDETLSDLNGLNKFVDSIDANTVRLFHDSGLTDPVIYAANIDDTDIDNFITDINDPSDIPDAVQVRLDAVAGHYDGSQFTADDTSGVNVFADRLNALGTLYIDHVSGNTFRLYQDSSLTNPLTPHEFFNDDYTNLSVSKDFDLDVATPLGQDTVYSIKFGTDNNKFYKIQYEDTGGTYGDTVAGTFFDDPFAHDTKFTKTAGIVDTQPSDPKEYFPQLYKALRLSTTDYEIPGKGYFVKPLFAGATGSRVHYNANNVQPAIVGTGSIYYADMRKYDGAKYTGTSTGSVRLYNQTDDVFHNFTFSVTDILGGSSNPIAQFSDTTTGNFTALGMSRIDVTTTQTNPAGNDYHWNWRYDEREYESNGVMGDGETGAGGGSENLVNHTAKEVSLWKRTAYTGSDAILYDYADAILTNHTKKNVFAHLGELSAILVPYEKNSVTVDGTAYNEIRCVVIPQFSTTLKNAEELQKTAGHSTTLGTGPKETNETRAKQVFPIDLHTNSLHGDITNNNTTYDNANNRWFADNEIAYTLGEHVHEYDDEDSTVAVFDADNNTSGDSFFITITASTDAVDEGTTNAHSKQPWETFVNGSIVEINSTDYMLLLKSVTDSQKEFWVLPTQTASGRTAPNPDSTNYYETLTNSDKTGIKTTYSNIFERNNFLNDYFSDYTRPVGKQFAAVKSVRYFEINDRANIGTADIVNSGTVTDSTTGLIKLNNTSGHNDKVSNFQLLLPGNETYLKRTGESTYVGDLDITSEYWTPGADSATTWSGNYDTIPQFSFTTNASGYLTGASVTNTGRIVAGSRALRLAKVADTYTPPALSTEAQEDVFDVDTEWDDQSFDVLKTFPTSVTPAEITVRVVSPTATTNSQNGTKYARTAGYSKYSIDVVYPPMTPTEYLDYNGFINALNGQKHPFYFDIIQGNTRMFGRNDTSFGVNGLHYKDDANAGDNVVLIEGFSSNQADAIKRGELFITDNKHGNIKTAGSSTDANIYGEAKFRFTTPLHSGKTAGQRIYNDPAHIIVSLDTDTVEVSRDTAGFYYLSLSFTADEWK